MKLKQYIIIELLIEPHKESLVWSNLKTQF